MPMTREQRSAAAKKGYEHTPVTELEDVVFPILEIVDELAVKYRLTEAMQRFLMWRLKFPTDAKCARSIGVTTSTINRWKFDKYAHYRGTPPDFLSAYRELMRRNRELAEKSMAMLGMRTVEVAGELLNATKKTPVVHDDKSIEIIETPDYENRYRGAQVVSNWMGEWGAKAPSQASPVYIAIMSDFQGLIEAKRRAIEGGGVVDANAVRISEVSPG